MVLEKVLEFDFDKWARTVAQNITFCLLI